MVRVEATNPDDVRQALAELDARGRKIVVGLFAVLVREPTKARDREWVARQLTQVVILAGDFEAETPQQGVDAVQAFLASQAQPLLEATFLLFQRVGLDLATTSAEERSVEGAMGKALEYLPARGRPSAGRGL